MKKYDNNENIKEKFLTMSVVPRIYISCSKTNPSNLTYYKITYHDRKTDAESHHHRKLVFLEEKFSRSLGLEKHRFPVFDDWWPSLFCDNLVLLLEFIFIDLSLYRPQPLLE